MDLAWHVPHSKGGVLLVLTGNHGDRAAGGKAAHLVLLHVRLPLDQQHPARRHQVRHILEGHLHSPADISCVTQGLELTSCVGGAATSAAGAPELEAPRSSATQPQQQCGQQPTRQPCTCFPQILVLK